MLWSPVRHAHGLPPRHTVVLWRMARAAAIMLSVTALLAVTTTGAAIYGDLPAWYAALAIALFLLFGLLGGLVGLYDTWRYVRIIPYFPRRVGEIETYLSGQELARFLMQIDALAPALSVTPLSAFGFNDDLCGEPLTWHSAAAGLATAIALRQAIENEHADNPATRALLDDLRKLEHALNRAAEQDIPFCLLLQHGNTTSGHEWDVRQGTAF